MNTFNPEAVGHAIAIGEGAVCDKNYEFCMKSKSVEIRGIMTPVEYEYISEFLKRTISMGGLTITEKQKMKSVLRDWVMELSLREQGSLICAARNCDLTPKNPLDAPERVLTAAIRYAFMNPADEREVDCAPGCFMISKVPNAKTFKVSALAHYPLHYVQKQMLACEVLAYNHPDRVMAAKWYDLYCRFCQGMHLNPESLEQYKARMLEDRIANNSVVS